MVSQKDRAAVFPGSDIFEALQYSADLLNQFGGHRQAAGLTMDANRIEELRCRLMQFGAERLSADDYIPKIAIDSQIGLADVDKALLEQLVRLSLMGWAIRDLFLPPAICN